MGSPRSAKSPDGPRIAERRRRTYSKDQPRERRRSRRVRPRRSVRLVDISAGGLTLQTDVPLQKGRVYDLILRLDTLRMPVSARVLRLRREGDAVLASLVYERVLESDREYLEQSLVREVADRVTVILR